MNKKLIVIAGLISVFAAGSAFAGVSWEPISPRVEGDNDATPALILLGLIAVVIAAGQVPMRSKAQVMEPGEVVEE